MRSLTLQFLISHSIFSSQPPRPALAPGRCGVGRTVGREGGEQGNFKLSGQNVKFTHGFTQQKEGERTEQAHPMPGSHPSAGLHLPPPPSFLALGQNRHKPQGLVAVLS